MAGPDGASSESPGGTGGSGGRDDGLVMVETGGKTAVAEALLDRAIARALLAESPEGLVVVDPNLRVVRFNTSAPGARAEMGQEAIGRTIREFAPHVVDDAEEQLLREVLDTGRAVIGAEVCGNPPSDPEHRHAYTVSIFRLQDPAGRVLGLLIASSDVTEQHRARARLDLLVKASKRIGTTLDVFTTAGEFAAVAVPGLADAAAVDVLEGVFNGEAPPPGPVGATTILRRAGFRWVGGPAQQSAYGIGETNMSYPASFTQCLADLQPRLIPHLEIDSEWAMNDPRRAEVIRQTGAHSLMVVPLTARGVILGLASFYRITSPDPFDDEDCRLAQELAARAAVCVDNARHYTRERTAALVLQRSLLPRAFPDHSAVEVAGRHMSERAGGDWSDVIALSGTRVALVVGHVVGHGMHAAAAMGRLRTAVHTLAVQDTAPDELLARLGDLITGADTHDSSPDSRALMTQATGASCVYAVYDPISRRLDLARAGHPAPVIAYPDGTVEVPDVPVGPPLGSGPASYKAIELELPQGTIIALYTESLLYADEPDAQSGAARLRQVLADPDRPLDDMCDGAVHALAPTGPKDDIVLLLARTRAIEADRVATWTLARDPAVVSTARTLADQQLGTWNLPELAFATELVVSELVTNAIRYGTGSIQLRLIRDRTLICEVSDGSSTAPHLRYARADDEGGRGLFLVAQIAHRWGTRYADQGKTIWAEQALP